MPLTITSGDLERLATECADGDKEAWLAGRGIDNEAIVEFCYESFRAFAAMLLEDGDVEAAIHGVAGFAFQVGFEACEQFRSRG